MDLVLLGLQQLADPITILWMVLGVVLGVVFGALPGVSATMAIVLCISFTYTMNPVVAIAFLASVYCAAITGGSITAILFKIPGTPSSAATVLDGYPMVQRGEAGKALSISLVFSGLGGLTSVIIMFLLTQPLMSLALKFNSAEQFAVCALGIGILIFVDSDHLLNTFLSALIGIWISSIGIDRLAYVPRFNFGSVKLMDGIEVLPFMLGIFAVAELFSNIVEGPNTSKYSSEDQEKMTQIASFKEFWELKWTAIRSSIIGTFVGIVPGAGATVASWISYSCEAKINKHPERMGKGDPHGICASEAANNAATGGAMVPLLAMGIPGSNAAAMMMTALAIHGVQMGPLLLKAQPEYLSATFIAMLFANIIMVFIALGVAKMFSRILSVPYFVLGTIILMLAITGCYAYEASTFDIWVLIIGGIFGYFFKKYNFNTTALILGMVLGGDMEYYLRRGLAMYGDFSSFFSRPVFTVIFVIFVVLYGYMLISLLLKRRKANKEGKV